MTTLKNVKTEISDIIFNMTGFNYDIATSDNNDGTENITFDSKKDAEKFQVLFNEINK